MRLQDSEADIAVDLPTDDSKDNSDIEKVSHNNFGGGGMLSAILLKMPSPADNCTETDKHRL